MHVARFASLRLRSLAAALAIASLPCSTAAQEPPHGPPPQGPEPEPEKELPAQLFPEDEDPAAEIIRLFHEVEKTLGAIDVELADAGSGQAPLGEGKESGIDRLLRSTRAKGDQAVSGIDRILELARQLQGGGT